jgi:hypothetical protein
MDLAGAFTLLNLRPEDVRLMMYEMTGELTMVHLAGMFGWTGMPFAFNVVTRVVIALISRDIAGLAKMFVDDIIAMSPKVEMRSDMTKTEGIVKQLLGSKAEEEEKRVTSEDPGNDKRRVDVIGWEIRLGGAEEEPSIGVSNRNLRKALYRFLSINEASEVTLEELQRLAGSAHRYTMICPFLRVFMGDLYCEYAGLDNKRMKRKLRE